MTDRTDDRPGPLPEVRVAPDAAVHAFGPRWIPQHVDVKSIRKSLGMTQQEFAHAFGFSIGTVRNWEQGHRQPDQSARVLLTVVARAPDAVARSLSAAHHDREQADAA